MCLYLLVLLIFNWLPRSLLDMQIYELKPFTQAFLVSSLPKTTNLNRSCLLFKYFLQACCQGILVCDHQYSLWFVAKRVATEKRGRLRKKKAMPKKKQGTTSHQVWLLVIWLYVLITVLLTPLLVLRLKAAFLNRTGNVQVLVPANVSESKLAWFSQAWATEIWRDLTWSASNEEAA